MSNPFSAIVSQQLTDDQAEIVKATLRSHNQNANPELWKKFDDPQFDASPLFVVAHDDNGVLVGGMFAETSMAWLKIAIMAVVEQYRRNGIGRMLIEVAEREAQSRGCKYSFLDTMSYQAPDFYRRCGYQEVGNIPDWDSHGHTKYFFTKQLQAAPDIGSSSL